MQILFHSLGGGGHSYLRSQSTHLAPAATAPNNVAFVAPNFPSCISVVNGTAAAMAAQAKQHKGDLQMEEYKNVTEALCKQLISAIKPAYIANLEDKFSRFNKVE
jgi:hypothetical protein